MKKIAEALHVPIAVIREGMGWTAPEPAEDWETCRDDALLFQGILEDLKGSYGGAEEKLVQNTCSRVQKQFQFRAGAEGFVLDESDVRTLLESIKSSIPALIEYMKDTRSEKEINSEILAELHIEPEGSEEGYINRYELTDEQWEAICDLLPSENVGKGRA